MAPLFRIGARGSPLSMIQARRIQARLAVALGVPAAEIDARLPVAAFTTTGDRIQDRTLTEAGGKGLFTKELDEALIGGGLDLAVHSAKDLPTRLPDGVALAAIPEREDPRDAFIARGGARRVQDLPHGAVLGTASLRRQAQALFLRGDLQTRTLRGNVETRLRKIEAGAFDATFLALAGLRRLGLETHASGVIAIEDMPPAAGQGALAITARSDDARVRDALAALDDGDAREAVAAERAFLEVLDGSCRTPIAAHAVRAGAEFRFIGEVLSSDGARRFRQTRTQPLGLAPGAAAGLGAEIAAALIEEAGADLPHRL